MKLFAIIFPLAAAFASTATATIAYGIQGGYDVAWISGDHPCGNTVRITSQNQIPCNHDFTLRNGFTYQLRDCGTPSFSLWNSDGSYNHICSSKGGNFGCDLQEDVHQQWQC